MALPPRNKLSKAYTMPAPNGEINTVHVKITRPKCIELVAMAASIYDEEKPHSRLVFAGQAVRIIKQKYIFLARTAYPDYDVLITFVLINSHDHYYTREQRTAIKKAVEKIKQENSTLSKVTIRMVILSTMTQITQYINQGRDYPRQIYPIGRIDVFAHGFPGVISLGYKLYDLVKDESGKIEQPNSMFQINITSIRQWQTKAFADTATFYSWACQTGDVDMKNRKNLANFIADHLQIPVYAFARRSEYAETWGNRSDRMTLRTQCNIPIVGNTDKCNQLIKENKDRIKNADNIKATWMGNGAVYPVKSGVTPEEAPAGMFVYYPNIKPPQPVTKI